MEPCEILDVEDQVHLAGGAPSSPTATRARMEYTRVRNEYEAAVKHRDACAFENESSGGSGSTVQALKDAILAVESREKELGRLRAVDEHAGLSRLAARVFGLK